MLEKTSRVTFIPGSPGVPADPGIPGHPAYCATAQVTDRIFVVDRYTCFQTGGGSNESLESTSPQATSRCIPNGGHYETHTRNVRTCYPAVAARPPRPAVPTTPAQWIILHNLGWNAGAYSVKRIAGDAEVKFKIPVASGVIIGFTHVSPGVSFPEIPHGLFFRQGAVRVYESGVPKGESFSFVPTDTFAIRRVGAVVSYHKNATLLYTSAVPSIRSLIVDCSLYSGGDRID